MTWPVNAVLTDGTVQTYDTMDRVPASSTAAITAPETFKFDVTVIPDLAQGITAYRCQRNIIRIGTDERLSIPCYQLRQGDKVLCYLFLTDKGPVLSAKDVQF